VRAEFTAKVQRGVALPRIEDGLDGGHRLGEPVGGTAPLAAVALFDVHFDLRPETEPEPALAHHLKVVCGVGQVQRAARQCDGDVGHQVHVGFQRGDDEGKEHVVLTLEGEDAVGTRRCDIPDAVAQVRRCRVDLEVDLHVNGLHRPANAQGR
jgi:hypothetical protein